MTQAIEINVNELCERFKLSPEYLRYVQDDSPFYLMNWINRQMQAPQMETLIRWVTIIEDALTTNQSI